MTRQQQTHGLGTIYQGHSYTAQLAGFKAHNGPFLCVTRGERGGKYLSGPDALTWADAITTAIDAREAAALCKAVYNG